MKYKKCLNCETILSDLIYSKHSVFRHIRVANKHSQRKRGMETRIIFYKIKKKKLNQQNEF